MASNSELDNAPSNLHPHAPSSLSPSGWSSSVIIHCKKCKDILADFGALLVSSSQDGGDTNRHVFSGLDGSGLARQCGIRDYDELLAVNTSDFKVQKVPHDALVEFLRNSGPTISLLLIRKGNEDDQKLFWVSFRLRAKGGKPVVKKHAIIDAGTRRSSAVSLSSTGIADWIDGLDPNPKLKKWALKPCSSSNAQVRFDQSNRVRIYRENGGGSNLILGIFNKGSEDVATYTATDAVMTMHLYSRVTSDQGGPSDLIAAFSSPVLSEKGEPVSDEVKCLGGDEAGPVLVQNFPSFMTDRRYNIPLCLRFFKVSVNEDGTYTIRTSAACKNALYIGIKNRRAWFTQTVQPSLSIPVVPSPSSSYRSTAWSPDVSAAGRMYPMLDLEG